MQARSYTLCTLVSGIVTENFPAKAAIVGTPISMTSYDEVLEVLATRPSDRATIVAVCNVYSVMSARRNEQLAEALATAEIATPDGMPLVWGLKAMARTDQEQVRGSELMRRGLKYGVERGWRHYFYGATEETLASLVDVAKQIAPGIQVVGSYSPPFRAQSDDELALALDRIKEAKPDLVWVGIGMPKQELWMHRVREELPGVALLGVGAAFDFISGRVAQAPPFLQKHGLEWAFRLSQEPRRLWRRYIWNNPAYLVLCARQVLKQKLAEKDRRR
jgi:N-acetylglucosaminyldiphosphoundecaprenol N-acetyl-beta-D-mannosaminyltransferase